MRFYLLVLAVMAAGIGVNTAMAQQTAARDPLRPVAEQPANPSPVSPM